MAQPAIQTSFASGEWAPKLRSRVDIQKYKVGASLLRNFYVDWAGGGASTRQGTQFIGQVGANGARLIPFQPSSNVTYVLEFGQNYIRFYSNGVQIMSGGIPYQIASPYAASDLFYNTITGNPGLKYSQDVTSLILTHPSYQTQILTIISPTNWTLNPANFGTTINTPTGLALASNLGAGTFSYGYTVTAVDVNGQESIPATPVTISAKLLIQSNNGTNSLTWTAVQGAQSYNVYEASPTVTVPIAAGAQYGFVGNVTGTTFTDTTPGIAPDFTQTPPIGANPFFGAPIVSYTVTSTGTYTTVPGVTIGAPPTGGLQGTAQASLGITAATINAHGAGSQDLFVATGSPNPTGSQILFANGEAVTITSVTFLGTVGAHDIYTINAASTIYNPGSITSGTVPTNPVTPISCNAIGASGPGNGLAAAFNMNLTWGVTQVIVVQPGAYLTPPSVTFSAGAAAATANLGPTTGSNPGCSAFIQERLAFGAQANDVQGFNLSQPNSFFNFNFSFPSEDDDAISGTIISEDLNNIKSLTPLPTGLLALTGKSAWLINGGGGISTMNPITPSTVTASPQSVHGASDLRPLHINMDVLYVTNRGNYVRDLTYNLYVNVFTGVDITTISNHLFFDYNIVDWCWAEDPFKTVWAVRDDGDMLSLGYVKDQEMMGWAHHDTNGRFKSVCSVLETDIYGNVLDAVYVIAERLINNAVVQYVERMQNRFFLYGYEDSWSVDCALQTAPQVSQPGILTLNIGTGAMNVPGSSVAIGDFTGATPFTPTMATNNWIIRANGGIYQITSFINTHQVSGVIIRAPFDLNLYNLSSYEPSVGGYGIWQPVTSVGGLTQLLNTPVVGVADGAVISGTVDGSGNLALPQAATKVTVGLSFLPQLQTLPLDLGEPTVQSKRKKVPAATLRVTDTLGLQIGTSFANAVTIKDFQIGAIPSQSNGPTQVADLFVGDGRQILDQVWQEVGTLCIQQNLPYPATILGVMPEVVVGDTPDAGRGK